MAHEKGSQMMNELAEMLASGKTKYQKTDKQHEDSCEHCGDSECPCAAATKDMMLKDGSREEVSESNTFERGEGSTE